MDYWAETMQDDGYLIAADGWVKGAQPREIVQVKNKDNKLVWPEPHDYLKGKRRFKSDLVPAPILIARYFAAERDAIEALDNQLATLEQQLDEMREEHSGEEGLLAEVIEGEGEKQKIAAKTVKNRLKEIGKDPVYADERAVLEDYADLLEQQSDTKARLKAAQEDLDRKLDAKYPKLTENEIKTLVVDDKWMARLSAAVQGELDRVSQTLTGRIRQLAERYATPLPQLTAEVATLASRVDEHLKRDGGGMEVKAGYKQTEVGVIPEEWDVKPLQNILRLPKWRERRQIGVWARAFAFINVLEPITYSHIYGPEISGQVTLPQSVAETLRTCTEGMFSSIAHLRHKKKLAWLRHILEPS